MDVKLVSDLLNVADLSRDYPSLKAIFDEAQIELAKVAKEIEDEKASEHNKASKEAPKAQHRGEK